MAIAIDPVCGMEVDTATSLLSLEQDGTTYHGCAGAPAGPWRVTAIDSAVIA